MFFLKLSWDLCGLLVLMVKWGVYLESSPLSTLWIQESDALVFVIGFGFARKHNEAFIFD